jgi:hypothetical protein
MNFILWRMQDITRIHFLQFSVVQMRIALHSGTAADSLLVVSAGGDFENSD